MENLSYFKQFPTALRKELTAHSSIKVIPDVDVHSELYAMGEDAKHVYIVASGEMQLITLGSEILATKGAGAEIGALDATLTQKSTHRAEAKTDCVVFKMDKLVFDFAWRDYRTPPPDATKIFDDVTPRAAALIGTALNVHTLCRATISKSSSSAIYILISGQLTACNRGTLAEVGLVSAGHILLDGLDYRGTGVVGSMPMRLLEKLLTHVGRERLEARLSAQKQFMQKRMAQLAKRPPRTRARTPFTKEKPLLPS
eukprot:g4238.t1